MLNKEVLTNIFKKLLEEAKNSYDDFNSADGKIGDGDLGVTILHGLEEINNSISKIIFSFTKLIVHIGGVFLINAKTKTKLKGNAHKKLKFCADAK